MKLSLIVPIHNEERNISPFYERVTKVLRSMDGIGDWDIVFVNNRSTDGSMAEVLKFRELDPRVKLITLSRNFGYHAGVTAGWTQADGDLIAAIDVDCEDPPELLVDFHAAIKAGAQVAYGIRSDRDEPSVITLMRRVFYHLNRRVADSEIVVWMSEFCMMTKQVRDAVLAPKTTYPFLRAELGYVGFKRVGISYRREARRHGRSHYNLVGMSEFAIGGILSSSTFPLRLVLYIAIVIGLIFPLGSFAFRLSFDQAAKAAVIIGFYFLLLACSTITIYLARTYKNGVARPVFIVDKERTFL